MVYHSFTNPAPAPAIALAEWEGWTMGVTCLVFCSKLCHTCNVHLFQCDRGCLPQQASCLPDNSQQLWQAQYIGCVCQPCSVGMPDNTQQIAEMIARTLWRYGVQDWVLVLKATIRWQHFWAPPGCKVMSLCCTVLVCLTKQEAIHAQTNSFVANPDIVQPGSCYVEPTRRSFVTNPDTMSRTNPEIIPTNPEDFGGHSTPCLWPSRMYVCCVLP